nr:unnamed protein product [Callosobruchus analis]
MRNLIISTGNISRVLFDFFFQFFLNSCLIYLEVKDPSTAICLYERAVLPLCLSPSFGRTTAEELWIWKLCVLEWLQKDAKEVLSCFEQGLQSLSPSPCLDLWMSYLEYSRRTEKDNAKLEKLFSDADNRLWEHDGQHKIARFHARLSAKNGNMPAARKIWGGILADAANKGWQPHGWNLRIWNDSTLRSIYKRALSACTDWQQAIVEEWLMYERENGSLEDFLKCLETCKSLVKVDMQAYSNQVVQQSYNDNHGRPVFISELKPAKMERKPAFKYSTTVENNKLFVKGLPVTKTKEEVEELFKPHKAVDVRVIMKKSGQSKGIAYVEFASEEDAQQALKATDGMKVDDHEISVAISAPPPKKDKKPETTEPIRHARSRLQVPLIPRSLQVKAATEKTGPSNGNPMQVLQLQNLTLILEICC